jgi:hypothetical protein
MPVRSLPVASLLVLVGFGLGGCATDSAAPVEFALSSPDIDAEGYVTAANTGDVDPYCDGENVSLEFAWTGVPDGTESFALLMTDPAYLSYDHWVVTGIPGDVTSIDAAPAGAVTVGTVGTNSRGAGNYVGPCQPDNAYLYTLYALDSVIEGDADTTPADALELIEGHVLGEASVEAMRH